MSRKFPSPIPRGNTDRSDAHQREFDCLWDYLTAVANGTSTNAGRIGDCNSLETAIRTAEDQMRPLSKALATEDFGLPAWFCDHVRRLEGLLDKDADVTAERFPDLFSPGADDDPRIGDFQIESLIGRGAMSCVFKGRRRGAAPRRESAVAIKLFLPDERNRDLRARFSREANTIQKLKCENIIRTLEVPDFATVALPYFVMEYAYGPTVGDLIDFHEQRSPASRVPVGLSLDIARQVACGLQYIRVRDANLIHRDVKPHNLLIIRTGIGKSTPYGWLVKIADFGLAKRADEPGGGGITQGRAILGTLEYMSPEHFSDGFVPTQLDAKVDVYSLGVVLAEMLTGSNPLCVPGPGLNLDRLTGSERIPPIHRTKGTLSKNVTTLVEEMLEPDPKVRLDCDEVIRQLDQALDSISPEFARKRKLRRIVASGIIVSLIVALAIGSNWVNTYRDQGRFVKRIDTLLDAGNLDDKASDELKSALPRVNDPHESDRLWDKLVQKLDGRIRTSLHIDDLEYSRWADWILFVKQSKPDAAAELITLLDTRFASFQTQWRWPGIATNVVFPANTVRVNAEPRTLELAALESEADSHRILTTSKCGVGGCRLRAEFGETWWNARQLGVELNASAKSDGYVFSLHPYLSQHGHPTAETIRSFSAVRDAGSIELRISRRGVVLRRSILAAIHFPAGPLALTATRQGQKLTLSVDRVAGFDFEDVFAPGSRTQLTGTFALHWPAGVAIRDLLAEDIARPVSPTALDLGDAQFDSQNYAGAEKAYGEAAKLDAGKRWAEEIEYKIALCHARLKRDPEETEHRFRAILAASENRWRPAAFTQLLSLNLEHASRWPGRAKELLDQKEQLFPDTPLAPVVRMVPESELSSLREFLFARVVASHASEHDHAQRIEAARSFLEVEKLLFGETLESQFWLSRAHARAGDFEKALRSLNAAPGRLTLQTLAERVWLLRLLGNSNQALEDIANAKVFETSVAGKIVLSVLRAECHDSLRGALPAEKELDLALTGVVPPGRSDSIWVRREWLPRAYLMRGFIRSERGDTIGAQEDWNRASEVVLKPNLRGGELAFASARSLAGKSARVDADVFLERVQEDPGASKLMAALESVIKRVPKFLVPLLHDSLRRVALEMWRTDEGRKYARKYAFRDWSIEQQLLIPKLLAGSEYLRQNAFHAGEDREVWEASWDLCRSALRYANAADKEKVVYPLAAVWFGNFDAKSLTAAIEALPEAYSVLRPLLAYTLSHRLLELGKTKEAAITFEMAQGFALRLEPPAVEQFAYLKRLIEADRKLLQTGDGLVTLKGISEGKLFLIAQNPDNTVRKIELLPGRATIVKAGEYAVEWNGAADSKFPPRFTVGICRRHILQPVSR